MNNSGVNFGKWLGMMSWDFLVTVRPHYRLTEYNSDRMIKRLFKNQSVNRLFYALEKDRECNMSHAHLLLKTNSTLDRKNLSKMLCINPKAIGYFDSVKSPKAVSFYCTKYVGKRFSHYDYFE